MQGMPVPTVAVFLDVLRDARAPMSAGDLKRRLGERGLGRAEADAAWRRAQRVLRRMTRYDPDARTYELAPTGSTLTPARALDELLRSDLDAAGRAALAETVRAALTERDDLEERLREAYRGSWQARGARETRTRAESARALARIAMEVEELAAAGAGSWVMVERVRALVRMCDLEPIGRAGEETGYDGARHAAVGGPAKAGARVSVIRPGYLWRDGDDEVLLDRAQVAPV
jgi:hypothetical protein